MKKIGTFLLVFGLGAVMLRWEAHAAQGPTSSSEALYEVMFTIPIGEAGVTYSVGEPRWGPQALALGPDGTFWIADTAADPDRIVHYSADGTRLDEVNLDGVSLGTSDLEVTEKEMILLSLATVPPKVVRTTLEGQLLASYDLPPGYRLEDGLTGIALGGEGEILVERMAGAYVAELTETKGELALTQRPGYPFHGVMYAGDSIDPMVEETKQGVVSAGETTVEVQVEHDLAGLRILGVNADGSFYVLVDEMRIRREIYDFETDFVGDLRVDETIRLYDAAGKPLGTTRAPRDLRYAEVAHELALGPDGAVYMMLSKADHVAILRLKLVDELKSIFSAEPEPEAAVYRATGGGIEELDGGTCRTRESMMSVAQGYVDNTTYLDSAHINNPPGLCIFRGKPRYLGQPGTYGSVPYDWGGGDTPSQFDNFMFQPNYYAGDYTAADPAQGCSRGVDCAGFVSSAWGIARQGTSNLYNTQSEALLDGWGAMQPGDVAIRTGTQGHVILYHHTEAYGMYCYESTTSGDLDRVVWTYHNWYWMDVDGYSPRRFINAPIFEDVPCSHWARPEIEYLKRNGYLAGCYLTPPRYCPSNSMPRKEMAVFVLRGVHGAGYMPPGATGQIFEDVPMGHPYIDWINQMYLEGYTAGCWANPLRFCPDNIHTRAESTVYMLHVKFGPTYMPPTPTVKPFADVELNTWYAKWVAAAKTYGLTRECGPNLFCPNDPLLRDVGAWMLYRAKD